MQVHKGLVVFSVSLSLGVQSLAACAGDQHKPIDTGKLFGVESTFGSEFKVNTKGPSDIDPKLLGQKLPPGVTFDPEDCRDYVASGRLPKGTRGRMSTVTANGEGNQFVSVAAQADKDIPFDAATAEKCKHVTFEVAKGKGRVSGFIDAVDAPQIDGVRTAGSHWQIETSVGEGEQERHQSREVYYYTANLRDVLVLVTVNAMPTRDQPLPVVDTDRARQLLVDSVSAVRP